MDADAFSKLVPEWDVTKNEDCLHPKTLKSTKYWWLCSSGHSFDATLSARIRGRGCPVCAGKKVLTGFNDVGSKFPHLISEWADTKSIHETLPGTHYIARWVCPVGHEYDMPVYRRATSSNPRGCSVCTGKVIISGVNDAESSWPHLKLEYSNRNPKPMNALASRSSARVIWECEVGHEWVTSIKARVSSSSGCPTCSNREFLPGFNDLATTYPELVHRYSSTNDLPASKVPSWGKYTKYKWECSQGHIWKAAPDNVLKLGSGCPKCALKTSQGEDELYDFVQSVLPNNEVLQSAWVLQGKSRKQELDIYIPELKIGIEYNGCYYHSEEFQRSSHSHADKRIASENQGIKLLVVWEDDWKLRRSVVERMIKAKLGVSEERRVYARQTEVVEIDYIRAAQFLEANHIQGKSKGSVYLGLQCKGELEAVMVLKKRTSNEYELTRYATASSVIGGHSKLVKWIQNNTKIETLVTFADLSISDGRLYEVTGWVLDKELPPDYSYLVNGTRREHKFNYRKARFQNDPNLLYATGLTETQLAELNNMPRVWDYGKKRYIMYLRKEI